MCFGEYHVDNLLRLVFMFPFQAGVPCIWTSDSQRILLDNFDAIHDSPSNLYHSALLLSPSSSWLHTCYSSELPQGVKVVRGLLAEWGMYSRTVLLNSEPWSLSYWNNTVAVGSSNGDILILDAITGSEMAILPGHTHIVSSLTFSSDGASLVSGSYDETVKLWDVQTGGVVKTFHGHTSWVQSVSISADCTIIASGSQDGTLRLRDIEMGECHHIIKQQAAVTHTRFSPTDPQFLVSIAGEAAQCWDIDGHKFRPTSSTHDIGFSPDGIQFVSCKGGNVTVKKINSGVTVAKFNVASHHCSFPPSPPLVHTMPYSYCGPCFSPDGGFVATGASHNIQIWNITGRRPHLVKTFVGHTHNITSFTFSSPSTLISASYDKSVKFWQISALPTDPVVTNQKSTSLTLFPTKSVAQKVKNRTIIPSDLPDGAITAWGTSTGSYKGPVEILAKDSHQGHVQLVGSKLIFVWYAGQKIKVWDAEKGELLQTIEVPEGGVVDLRLSGDGSKVFCLYKASIHVWDIWTREAVDIWTRRAVDKVESQYEQKEILAIDGSKVWTEFLCSDGPCHRARFSDFFSLMSLHLLDSVTFKTPHLFISHHISRHQDRIRLLREIDMDKMSIYKGINHALHLCLETHGFSELGI